jgi:maleylacetoacetate isomerase
MMFMTNITLWTYYRSSAAYRVRIALNLKGLAHEAVPVDLVRGAQREAAFVARNPQGRVPFLVDGDTGLAQSLAIIGWLDERYPVPALLPADPVARAQVRGFALAIACDIHPLNNLAVLRYLKEQLGHDQTAIDDWYRHWIRTGFEALEQMTGPGPWCFGDAPTLADICLVPQLYNARRFNTELSAFPRLVAAETHARAHPAFAAAAPEAQADAPDPR